jgi:hypothetical protein
MEYINETEIAVVALQRSGHHAIINWIIANSSNEPTFLNNCQPCNNPFLTCSKTDSLTQHLLLEKEQAGFFSKKELLIHNYEDKNPFNVFDPVFYSEREKWLGKSKTQYNVLILRDPFNNFASKYRWTKEGTKWQPSLDSLMQLPAYWKVHAREFLNETNSISENKICISYNHWFTDASYREELAQKLHLTTIDKGLSEIAKWGPNTWGDSFDNLTYDNRASEMKVFERWKHYKDDPLFISLFEDPELIELSDKIFGHLVNSRLLLANCI